MSIEIVCVFTNISQQSKIPETWRWPHLSNCASLHLPLLSDLETKVSPS